MTSPFTEDVLDGAADKAAPDVSGVLDAKRPTGSLGPLLEEQDEKKVVLAVVQLLHDEAANRRRRRAEWECYKLWLRGVRGARVRRAPEDRNAVELVLPLGALDLPPLMDRADELLEKVVAHLNADPAVPEAEPATDSDPDRDSAEFTTRLLTVEGSESGYNNNAVMRKAMRKAGVYGSGFIYTCIDPQGGGWKPMEVKALPMAMSTEDAALDPMSGMQVGDDDPRLTTRFVAQGGQLVDDPQQADVQWLPKLKKKVLTGENVVLLPNTCSSVNDAHGCLLIEWTPLGTLKALYPDKLNDLDESELQELVDWRPEDVKHAKPGFLSGKDVHKSSTDAGKVTDAALVCTLSLYYKSHGRYPKGAYITVAGGETVLHKQPWSGMVEQGPGKIQEECLMLPLSQVRQLDDDIDDDPYGYGLIRKLGPADEVRGDIILAWLEYLDRFGHPIPFIPLGSIVQPEQFQVRDDTPVYFNPQGEPKYEKVEAFPADAKEFFDRATQAQDSATMLEEAAQGVDTQTATSGIAKQIVVQQAHVNMATMRNNAADGQERDWRVTAQLIRVFYTIPQKLKYLGDDGSYKEKEWTRADLGSTKDIRIARGSFTQMSPEQKQQMLDMRLQTVNPATGQPILDPEEYERLSSSNIRATIGFKDNPHRMRVRRQISAWRDGDANAFADMRSVDEEQDVARIRWLELRREMAGGMYLKNQNAPALEQAYLLARQAAGIATIAEQQQMAMQQQQAAADQQAQSEGQQIASKERQQQEQLGAQGAEAEAQRQFEAQMAEQEQEMERERMAMEAQSAPV